MLGTCGQSRRALGPKIALGHAILCEPEILLFVRLKEKLRMRKSGVG
jgi:hypothetical protein